MKLLLTSGGIRNASLLNALVRLLGKPVAECSALLVPTALYGHPHGTPAGAWRFVNGRSGCPMRELGWKSLGLLELTALPSIGAERWIPWVQATDALLVDGGDAVYLGYWMRQSGLAALLPSLQSTVWVGLSAGSMVMTPRVGYEFVETKPPLTGSDATLGVVPFSIFPHLVLLCQIRSRTFSRRQHGHLGSVLSKAAAIRNRKVVMDERTWRCVRGAAARFVMRG